MTASKQPLEDMAARRYPLPKITRPRVVCADGYMWSLRSGRICYTDDGEAARGAWYVYPANVAGWNKPLPTPSLIDVWADLFARPMEEIDDVD